MTQDLSNAKDLVSSSPVLSAHIQKQSYSSLQEVYIFCKFQFSHIIVVLDNQIFLPHGGASGDL